MNPRLYTYLQGHQTAHAFHVGWDLLDDVTLLRSAEEAGYDVLITSDKKMFDQQNNAVRRISLIVLSATKTTLLRAAHQRICAAVEASTPGSYTYIDLLADA